MASPLSEKENARAKDRNEKKKKKKRKEEDTEEERERLRVFSVVLLKKGKRTKRKRNRRISMIGPIKGLVGSPGKINAGPRRSVGHARFINRNERLTITAGWRTINGAQSGVIDPSNSR